MTHAELIIKLGGGAKLADAISAMIGQDLDRENVYAWKKRNQIPHKWRPYVVALARRENIEVPQDLAQPLALAG